MNVLSLFSGIGAFDLAFERNGDKVVAQSEIDKHCSQVLGKHFPDVPNLSDVRGVDGRNYRGIDVICGGSPCQDVSQAGRRAGLAGERSSLWFEFARIIEEAKPKIFLFENVTGLLTSNQGRDFGSIIGSMAELGYAVCWRILDSQYAGVPQRRRRVFIVGCFGNPERARQILFEPESGSRDIKKSKQERGEVVGTLASRTRGGGFPGSDDAFNGYVIPYRKSQKAHHSDDCETWKETEYTNTLSSHSTDTGHAILYRKKRRPTNDPDDVETWEEAQYTNTLDAGSNVTRTAHAIAFHMTQDPIVGDELSPAISTGGTNGSATIGISTEWGVRKLMPIECERLMGFPDNWTEGHADTNRYKMLGNSVVIPVLEYIVERINHGNL